jgi:dihydrofolate reductase
MVTQRPPIHAIVAISAHDRGIGYKGQLPWKISKDMDFFKRMTIGIGQNVVIMGRKTWESIPPKFRPFSNRWNIVLSKQVEFLESLPSHVTGATSLSEAIQTIQKSHLPIETIWIIGGSQIYQEALQKGVIDRVFVTVVKRDPQPQCDVFFPELSEWTLDLTLIPEEFKGEFKENDYSFTFQSFIMKQAQNCV